MSQQVVLSQGATPAKIASPRQQALLGWAVLTRTPPQSQVPRAGCGRGSNVFGADEYMTWVVGRAHRASVYFCEQDAQSVLVKGAILQSLGCMLRSSHLESLPRLCSSHSGCMHQRNLPEIQCCENTSTPPEMKYRPQWTQNVLRKGSRGGITPTAPFLPTAAWCSPKMDPFLPRREMEASRMVSNPQDNVKGCVYLAP